MYLLIVCTLYGSTLICLPPQRFNSRANCVAVGNGYIQTAKFNPDGTGYARARCVKLGAK